MGGVLLTALTALEGVTTLPSGDTAPRGPRGPACWTVFLPRLALLPTSLW